jgi:hypothetical protein
MVSDTYLDIRLPIFQLGLRLTDQEIIACFNNKKIKIGTEIEIPGCIYTVPS